MSAPACPHCGGSEQRLIAPGFFECTSRVLQTVIPAGAQGNSHDVPMYGRCGRRYQAGAPATATPQCACGLHSIGACARCGKHLCGDHGTQAPEGFICAEHIREDRERADEAERAAVVAAKRSLAQRKAAALATLRSAGDNALQRRRVPGGYNLTPARRIFGRVGIEELVETEAAWPVGTFTWGRRWMRGSSHYEDLETGLTPSERLVPMKQGVKGDPGVDPEYQRWWLGTDPADHGGKSPTEEDIVAALERLASRFQAVSPQQQDPDVGRDAVLRSTPTDVRSAPELPVLRASLRAWLEAIPTIERRLLVTCLYLSSEVPRSGRYDYNPRRFSWVEPDLLAEIFADFPDFFSRLWGTEADDPLPIASERLARWFRDRAIESGAPANYQYPASRERRRRLNAGTRTAYGKPVPAWAVAGTYILAEPWSDGSVCVGQIHIPAASEMARLLQLEPPPDGLVDDIADARARQPAPADQPLLGL